MPRRTALMPKFFLHIAIPMKHTTSALPRRKLLSDKRLIAAAVLLCLVYFLWFNHPFPLHNGALSKQEAADAALEYFGLDPEQSETAVTYDADKSIIAYLQKEKLIDSYMEQHDIAYPLDFYRVEIEGPDSLRYEALVHLYEGFIAGWSREAAEHQSASSSDEQAALQAAEHYLREQRPGDLSQAEVISSQQPDGTYTIRYKQLDDRIGDAYRMAVVQVAGDTVVSYRSLFMPPDDFLRWLDSQDDRSGQFTNLTLWISAGMAAAALAIAIAYRQLVRWTDGFVLVGITIVIEALYYTNILPNYVSMIDYRQAGTALFIMEFVFNTAITTIYALTVYLPYIGGKALLVRDGMHHMLSPLRREDWQGTILKSYSFAVGILAVQTMIFNLAEATFHIWWIPDPTLVTDNMLWPLTMPLTAWAAAISEEIVYRLFAITVFKKLFRSSSAAVLLSSMIWALGHTAYPVYPVYTRFIEVTIIGIIFGYIFIRFGFATAVFTHAVVDSILMGFDVASVGMGGVFATVIYIALPVLVGYLLARLGPFKTPDHRSHRFDLDSGYPHPPRFR